MLQYLQIQDLALIDQTTLEFDEGFTCITGETGAGKSVMLGALAMLSGNRLDRTIIRHGQDFAKVEATIAIAQPDRINAKLRELELPECEDGALLLSRTLHQKKLPKIQVNGALTTLANLSELGEYWIDFHGPGEPQKLFKEKFQLELLDLFSAASEKFASYQQAYDAWVMLTRKLEALQRETQLSPDEIHYLQDQIRKIEELGVDADSLEALEAGFQRMSRSEELLQLLQTLQQALFEEGGASEKLATAIHLSASIQEIDPGSEAIWKRLESLSIELEDLNSEIAELADAANLDEVAVEELKYKMELWMDLKRKHGKSSDAILGAKSEMEERLATHGDIKATLERLEAEKSAALKRTIQLGTELNAIRQKGATLLSQKVTDNLHKLGFKKALFQIELIAEPEPTTHGTSRCQMCFAPNPGQPLLPLNKIASSGETARVMLALKTVLADFDATPILVFDEVDANVGGEIGKAVGREMAALAHQHQVFCVTHLPQVAALADEHFVVVKSQTDDSTQVTIEHLESDGAARVQELARMLGDRESDSALNHARELLAKG